MVEAVLLLLDLEIGATLDQANAVKGSRDLQWTGEVSEDTLAKAGKDSAEEATTPDSSTGTQPDHPTSNLVEAIITTTKATEVML